MEAGADDDVGVVESVEQGVELGGLVLAVGVDLDHRRVALAVGVEEGRAHGAADADVEGQHHDGRAGPPRELGGVRRSSRRSRRGCRPPAGARGPSR